MNRNNDFAMEYNDSLLKASERIRDLLKIKYHGDEYQADTTKGNESNSKLQTIISKVNNATKLIYATELLFTNTGKTEIQESVNKDDAKYLNQYLEPIKKLNNDIDKLKVINNKLESENEKLKAELLEKEAENELTTINGNSPSKNSLKIINKLKSTVEKNEKSIDANNDNILKYESELKNYTDKFNAEKNIIDEEKDKRDSNRQVNYIRGDNAYIDASNNFKSLELLMRELINDIQKLLPDIGYSEPESITTFYDAIKDFDATNESLKKRLYSKYKAEIAKDLPKPGTDITRIYAGYNKLLQNIGLFYKSVDRIRETYNYIQSSANANSHNDSTSTEVPISSTEKKDLSGGSYLTRIRKSH